MDVKTVTTSVVVADELKKDAIVDIDKIVERRLFSELTDHILKNKDKLPIDITEEHKPWLDGTEHRLTLYLISKEELKRLKRIDKDNEYNRGNLKENRQQRKVNKYNIYGV